MHHLGVSVRLRPLRFAFLVRPNDARSLQRIFEINTSLWGGMFNPIIPYFERIPKWWHRDRVSIYNARRIMDGFLAFFEPDFVVEAEKGLAEKLDLGKDVTLQLDNILSSGTDRFSGQAYGLNIFDLYKHLYQKEFKFVRRHEHRIINASPKQKRFTLLVSCLFGTFPEQEDLSYIGDAFKDAFDPAEIILDSEQLVSLYEKSYVSALRIGYSRIEAHYSDLNEPTLFLLDATEPKDLIDFWNLRAIQRRVYAIPIQWIESLSDFCKRFIVKNHVPLPRNPHGVMVTTTIQIPRSLSEKEGEELVKQYLTVDQKGAASIRLWYPRFWTPPSDLVWSPMRPVLTVKKKTFDVTLSSDESTIRFDTLNPDFAEDYGNDYRWANVVQIEDRFNRTELATVFPNSLREPSFPRLNPDRMLSTTEGLVVYPRFKELGQYWQLIDGTSAFIKWLEKHNVEAKISDAGKTTLQLIRAVGGLNGICSIAHRKLVELLNKMAHKQVEIDSEAGKRLLKEYYGRTVTYNRIDKLLRELNKTSIWAGFSLQSLNQRNVLRLGLEVKCSECEHWNWYSVDSLSYGLVCKNCLKEYAFPSAQPTNRRLKWCYRVMGPFCKPDYAGGAYTSAFAIRFFSDMLTHFDSAITWSTSLELRLKSGEKTEADFVLWYQRRRGLDHHHEPKLVFGESKSFGKEVFKNDDVKRLKILASHFPGSILVFATMKDRLSKTEKRLIAPLALWGREYAGLGETRAPVIILTGTELFSLDSLCSAWKDKGGRRAKFVETTYFRTENLHILANLTQQLYLDLPPFDTWLQKKYDQRAIRKATKKSKALHK